MKKAEVMPLSANELVDAERFAKIVLDPTQQKADKVRYALAGDFLRLLALHRATERQSAILQSQVRMLEDTNNKLEAALDAASPPPAGGA